MYSATILRCLSTRRRLGQETTNMPPLPRCKGVTQQRCGLLPNNFDGYSLLLRKNCRLSAGSTLARVVFTWNWTRA